MTTLSLTDRIRISDDVLFRNLEGEAVLVHLGRSIYFGLDPVGTRIWELLQGHEHLEDVHHALVGAFDVTEDTAREDLLRLVGELREAGLVEVSPGDDVPSPR